MQHTAQHGPEPKDAVKPGTCPPKSECGRKHDSGWQGVCWGRRARVFCRATNWSCDCEAQHHLRKEPSACARRGLLWGTSALCFAAPQSCPSGCRCHLEQPRPTSSLFRRAGSPLSSTGLWYSPSDLFGAPTVHSSSCGGTQSCHLHTTAHGQGPLSRVTSFFMAGDTSPKVQQVTYGTH